MLLLPVLVASPALAAPPLATAIQSITYEAGACLGYCPVYRVTINSNGTGSFEGRRFTAVTGTRSFRASFAQYQAFARQLEPIRPVRGSFRYDEQVCGPMITDQPSVTVLWRSRRATQRLYFYYGCDPQRNHALAERLSAAPTLLPIGDFIGRRR